jgi:pimeloyl-ACP methyl ester carboxylesterase
VLPSVPHPALVIGGRLDPLATTRWCEEVAALLPHGQLRMIDRAGHAMQHSAPAATADAVLGFLHLGRAPEVPARTL